MISTGTPLVEALAALERQAKEPGWRRIVAGVRVKVEDGASLSAAMACYPKYFDAVCRSLVAAGESAGNLDVMLDRLGVLTRKQAHVRSAVIGAMVYPSLLIFVAMGVLLTMLVFVLPRFALLFKSLDSPVERARLKLHARKRLDILHQRVAVFRSVGEAREDQCRSARVLPERSNR